GSSNDAISVIRQALATVGLPRVWQARLLALLAQVERQTTGFDAAESISRRALTAAEEVRDPFATVQALHDLWLIHSVRRDHAAALDCIDQALSALGDDPGLADLQSIALDCHAEAGRDSAAARRRDDPDPPVAARPGPARGHRRRQKGRAGGGGGVPGRGRGGDPAGPGGSGQPAVLRTARVRSGAARGSG